MYLVVVGQWDPDESWAYDPLLAVEVSEIGSTLIALSVPALKPFFGTLASRIDRSIASWGTSRSRSKNGTIGLDRDGDETGTMIALEHRYERADSMAEGEKRAKGSVRSLLKETV